MSRRGGARPGAGRKSKLTKEQELYVGAFCDGRWNEEAEKIAWEKYESDPQTKMVRLEQSRVDQIHIAIRGRPGANKSIKEIGGEIDDIIGPSRLVSLPLQRPYGLKSKILAEAVVWCESRFMRRITPNKAGECWEAYKHFDEWQKAQSV